MTKAKYCLIAVVSGVLVATAVLSGCGQSKKEVSKNDDHLTVYLWENRLMKNIAPYIHELVALVATGMVAALLAASAWPVAPLFVLSVALTASSIFFECP